MKAYLAYLEESRVLRKAFLSEPWALSDDTPFDAKPATIRDKQGLSSLDNDNSVTTFSSRDIIILLFNS
jgi:hypothetical protein